MFEPLSLPELAQQKRKCDTTHNYTSYVKKYQLFKNKEEFKLKLGFLSVTEGFQMRVTKSTSDMFKSVCFVENFKWQIQTTKNKDIDTFEVVKLSESHTCSNTQLCPHH